MKSKTIDFFWTGESTLTKETMLSAVRNETGEERSERQDAVAFLREVLGNGKKLAKDVQSEARQAGISDATLRRAKLALKIQSRRDSFQNGKWFWQLPEEAQDTGEDIQINISEHLQINNSNNTSYKNNLAEDAQYPSFEHLPDSNEHLQQTGISNKCPNCKTELKTYGNNQLFCEICLYSK